MSENSEQFDQPIKEVQRQLAAAFAFFYKTYEAVECVESKGASVESAVIRWDKASRTVTVRWEQEMSIRVSSKVPPFAPLTD